MNLYGHVIITHRSFQGPSANPEDCPGLLHFTHPPCRRPVYHNQSADQKQRLRYRPVKYKIRKLLFHIIPDRQECRHSRSQQKSGCEQTVISAFIRDQLPFLSLRHADAFHDIQFTLPGQEACHHDIEIIGKTGQQKHGADASQDHPAAPDIGRRLAHQGYRKTPRSSDRIY